MNSHTPAKLFKDSDYINTLTNLCMETILENFRKIFLVQNWPPIINPNIYLPSNFTESLLDALNDDFNYKMQPALMSCLKNSENFPIRRLNLKHIKTLTNEDLLKILKGNLITGLIINSPQLSSSCIDLINSKSAYLTHLGLGKKCLEIFQKTSANRRQLNQEVTDPPKFNLPNLQILSINVKHPDVLSVFDSFELSSFAHKLTVLDLSDCSSRILFDNLRCFTQLKYLSLHNIILTNFHDTLCIIQQLTTLKSVDLGMSYRDEPYCYGGNITLTMSRFLSSLNQLESLEICGTNLAGIKAIQPVSVRMKRLHEDPGVEWLVDKRLQYLGLLNCIDQPCIRENIFADTISGDDTIGQILVSLEKYQCRYKLFLLSLNRFFEVIKNENLPLDLQAKALDLILKGMKKYFEDNSVQISGSATLFYLVKGDLKEYLTNRIKRRTIKVLLDAMESFTSDPNMARNGCLTLCNFRFPTDLLHDYTRVVNVLLMIVSKTEITNDVFVHRVALNLLNSLACQVDKPEKLILGQLPTFKIMLDLVTKRVEADKCDELMEVAWSLMWNATDETAANCEKFIEHMGLQIFTQCLTAFPDSEELLRNMMGLLGNVAEVYELRQLLMQYVDVFAGLLDSKHDGIEVSYNACGVLANLLFDGLEAWTVNKVSRALVIEKMENAIQRWPINIERNINYRSFKPILRLLECTHTPVVQYWAVWALCNLTKVYRKKYCPLLSTEGGIEKLKELHDEKINNNNNNNTSESIKSLSMKIIKRTEKVLNGSDLDTDDNEANEEENMMDIR